MVPEILSANIVIPIIFFDIPQDAQTSEFIVIPKNDSQNLMVQQTYGKCHISIALDPGASKYLGNCRVADVANL